MKPLTCDCKGKELLDLKTVILPQSQLVFRETKWEIINLNIIKKKFKLLEDLFGLQTL